MIGTEVTFVIGAGAGADVEMPVGAQLASHIANDLRVAEIEFGTPGVSAAAIQRALMREANPKSGNLIGAAQKISKGVAWSKSIDDFLETHSEDSAVVEVGKLAIAHSILQYEKHSRLHVNSGNIYNSMESDKLSGSWFTQLARIMYEGVKTTDIEEVFAYTTFINFNYDRCLEQFLTYSLKERFSVNTKRAHEIVSKARIYHPYGSLGPIGFMDVQGGIRFGGNDSNDLGAIARGIRTYSESALRSGVELREIQSAFREAETIVFLGFAYHRQNCMLLQSDRPIAARQILGTTVGLSEIDVSSVREWLVGCVDHPMSEVEDEELKIDLKPLECRDFLQHYQLLLSGHW